MPWLNVVEPVHLGLERMLPDWRVTKCKFGAKSLQQTMKLVLLKLTLEIQTMQISKHVYICGRRLFPTFYLRTYF